MPRWPDFGWGERRWKRDPDEEVRPAKTLWDVMELLVVPIVITVLAFAFNGWQAAREADREERRAKSDRDIAAQARHQDQVIAREARLDETLRTYVTDVSDLILDRKLLSSPQGSDVQAIARTLTLTA